MIIRKILQGENHSIFINDAFRFFAHQFPQILIVFKFINARVRVTNSNLVHLNVKVTSHKEFVFIQYLLFILYRNLKFPTNYYGDFFFNIFCCIRMNK